MIGTILEGKPGSTWAGTWKVSGAAAGGFVATRVDEHEPVRLLTTADAQHFEASGAEFASPDAGASLAEREAGGWQALAGVVAPTVADLPDTSAEFDEFTGTPLPRVQRTGRFKATPEDWFTVSHPASTDGPTDEKRTQSAHRIAADLAIDPAKREDAQAGRLDLPAIVLDALRRRLNTKDKA